MKTQEEYQKIYEELIGFTPPRIKNRIRAGLECDPEADSSSCPETMVTTAPGTGRPEGVPAGNAGVRGKGVSGGAKILRGKG